MNFKVKTSEPRENLRGRVAFGLSFESDWSRKWREFSEPITSQRKAKPKQSWITVDTRLKIAQSRVKRVRLPHHLM